ncbi:SPFH domain-containing protein [Planctomycetota bacterium]
MTISSRRAKNIAWFSLVTSIVFFVVILLISRWSGAFALFALSWFILSSALIWLVLVLQFHQRTLAEQEKLDISQLGKNTDEDATIFSAEGRGGALFAVAQKRLVVFEKWFLPVFAAIIAVYQLFIGLYLLKSCASATVDIKQPLICAICMTAVAFVCFLISRYATGMSQQINWRPLRAGGSIFLVIAILAFLLAIALAMVQFKIFFLIKTISWIVPILITLLGAEFALNFVFDIYRPRVKGKYSRTAFDSRILGVINEPGGIFRSAATAIDYQFGFKVSQTWFYRLLEKAIVPLVLFGATTLYLLSCVVVVAPDEQAIVEHFGNPVDAAGQVRLLEPGLAFKWPWPIDVAYKYSTKRTSDIEVGFVAEQRPESEHGRHGPLLWGQKHYEKEELLLVASQHATEDAEAGTVPVSLIIAVIPVQYRINDLYSYIYNHNDPEKLFEAICYRELTNFAASASIEIEGDRERSLLCGGRANARAVLTQRIQKAVNDAGLGVEIVFLGLQGIHPPLEVAKAYDDVVGAVQEKQKLILRAHSQRNKILSKVVGSVKDADELYKLATDYRNAKSQNDSERIEELGGKLDEAFAAAKGEIFSILRNAQSYSFKKVTLAGATGRRFADQRKAYLASPQIYIRQQLLNTLEDSLEDTRKYVIVADVNDAQTFIIDVKDKLTPSLYDLGEFEENTEK